METTQGAEAKELEFHLYCKELTSLTHSASTLIGIMFETLDDIAWKDLAHAYGSAENIPKLLRDLINGDDEAAQESLYEFYGNIHHQGTVYTASAPAVPFLVAALPVATPSIRSQLLSLLSMLAQGHGYYEAHQTFDHIQSGMNKWPAGEQDKTIQIERRIVKETTLAVFNQWENICKHLNDENLEVRQSTLHLLTTLAANDAYDQTQGKANNAFFNIRPKFFKAGQAKKQLLETIDNILNNSTDIIERTGCLEALLLLNFLSHKTFIDTLDPNISAAETYAITKAKAQKHLQSKTELPLSLTKPILTLIEKAETLEDIQQTQLACWYMHDPDPSETIFELAAHLSDEAIEKSDSFFVHFVKNSTCIFELSRVLNIALGTPIPNMLTKPCTLIPARKAIALALVAPQNKKDADLNSLWNPQDPNASSTFKFLKIPHDRILWRKWLNT